MTFFEEHSGKVWATIFGLVATGGTWLVRTIFTNHKRLDLLEQKQDMQHAAAMEGLSAVRDDIHEIKTSNDNAIQTQVKIVEILREIRGGD